MYASDTHICDAQAVTDLPNRVSQGVRVTAYEARRAGRSARGFARTDWNAHGGWINLIRVT